MLLQGLLRRRGMELHDIKIVGLHPGKTLLNSRHDVVAREDVCPPLAAWHWGCAEQTAALAGQIIFSTPMRDIPANPLLAQSIINRGVDVVDAAVEHLVENGFRLPLCDIAAARCPA